MRPGNWDGLLLTGKARQSTLSVSLNDIGESRYPAHSGPLSDADTLALQVCICVVEALLIAIYLPEGKDVYIHIRPTLLPKATSVQLGPAQLNLQLPSV
jgi:hypothetical protein